MANLFQAFNGASPTSAALAPITTGTAIKTLQQIATPSTKSITIVEWGISFDGSAAATPIKVELIDVNVAATVTAYTTGGIIALGRPSDEGSAMTLSTTGSGFTSSGEGTVTGGRLLDYQLVAPTNQYIKQWPLGREPVVTVSRFLRIRVTAAAAVNAVCYVTWEE